MSASARRDCRNGRGWKSNTTEQFRELLRRLRPNDLSGSRSHEALLNALHAANLQLVSADDWKEVTSIAREKIAQPPDPLCCWPHCTMRLIRPESGWPLCIDHTFQVETRLQKVDHLRETLSHKKVDARLKKDAERERAQKARESAGNQPGFVYYISFSDRVKIGFATDVKKRMAAYPPDAKLLAVHPGTPDLEKEMHRKFAHALVAGREWFRHDLAIAEHIEDVLQQFGDPKDHAHHFRRSNRDGNVRVQGSWRRD